MVNQNKFGLRGLALRSFSQIIDFCKRVPVVTDQVKLTRKGLQRICMTYVQGLTSLYCQQASEEDKETDKKPDASQPSSLMSEAQRKQVLDTLKDFSSIAKIGTLNNLFLMSFAELVDKKQANQISSEQIQN